METEKLFPIFGQLHQDDSHAVVIPCEKPARKVYENTAKLFVVPDVSVEQGEQLAELAQEIKREEQAAPDLLKVTCNIQRDAVLTLYCLAYLSEFFSALEPTDLRHLADLTGGHR